MAVLKYYNTTTSAWEYIAASTTANFTTWKKTATGGETSVSGTDDNAVTLSYTVGLEQVFINGVLQVRGSDYTATNGTSITGLTALVASDIVTVVCYAPFNIANTIAPTVVDAKGDLLAGTAADTVGRLAVGTVNGQVLAAASGEATGLKWNYPSIVQIVEGTYSTQTSSSSSTFADTGLTASITPKATANKVLVLVQHTANFKTSASSDASMQMQLVRGATNLNTQKWGYTNNSAVDQIGGLHFSYLDSPNTTSSTTYKTQFASEGSRSSVQVQQGNTTSRILLIEVAL
jgi:hypothetical protein